MTKQSLCFDCTMAAGAKPKNLHSGGVTVQRRTCPSCLKVKSIFPHRHYTWPENGGSNE